MLTVATYLGSNTLPALAALVEQIRDKTGLDISFEQHEPASSPDARAHAADHDLVWMCGGLYAEMTAAGELDHEVIGAPVFAGETDAIYRSVIVARPDGPTSIEEALATTVAINEPASWSGHRALRRHVAPNWFADEIISGAHVASIDAVCSQTADCAAIDHSIWDHERAVSGSAANQLVVIDQTRDWPAPPFLISRRVDAETTALVTGALLVADPVPGVQSVRGVDAESYAVMAPSPEEEEFLT